MTAIQNSSISSRAKNAVSDAVSTTWDAASSGVRAVGSKIYNIWNCTPKAVKLPLEAAAILYTPGGWMVQGAASAAVAWAEIPQEMAAFCRGQPMNLLGARLQLFQLLALQNDPLPADPKAPLTELDKKIHSFERAQVRPVAPIPKDDSDNTPTSGVSAPHAPASMAMEKVTDANLEVLIEKVSYFSILKALHSSTGIEELEPSPQLLRIVDEATRKSNGQPPSVWKLFTAHYGKKMSMWGRIKAGFTYLFLWKWISIIPKTVDAYLKNLLSELRIHLKENGEKRKKLINGILEDSDNFLEIYNGAAETYANDHARKGNLNKYRKAALDLNLSAGESTDPSLTPEEVQREFYRKLSCSIVDNFSPKIRFGFAENWLNNKIRSELKKNILPDLFLNVSIGGKEAAKRHNIPFLLALTKTMTEQIAKLQGKLEQGASGSDSSSLAGIKNFEGIVKKLMRAIDLADCKTPEEVKARINKLKAREETNLDASVREGIEEGIQKGMAVLFDYLSKQENTEELFAILFESLSDPLSGKLPIHEEQWKEIETEYTGAKIRLKQSASALFDQIVKEAVQDEVRGGSSPDVADRAAQTIFAEHQSRGTTTFADLSAQCSRMREKIHQSKTISAEEISIHPELYSIASSLKAFENEERVKITMNQDPPPRIAALPKADRESVLRVLYPLYEGSNQLMDRCSLLQTLQKEQTVHSKVILELRKIKKVLVEIVTSTKQSDPLTHIALLKEAIEKLDTYPEASAEIAELKEHIEAVSRHLTQLNEERKAIDALDALQPFNHADPSNLSKGLIGQLALFVHGNSLLGFKKWKCIEQIKALIKNVTPLKEDQDQLLDLVEKINKYNTLPQPRPDFNDEIWIPLAIILNQHKIQREQNCNRHLNLLDQGLPIVHQLAQEHEERYETLRKKNWEKLSKEAARLNADVTQLHQYIQKSRKEKHLRPSAAQLGRIGGTAGAALGSLLALAGSAIGSTLGGNIGAGVGGFLGAGAAYGVRNLGKLATKKERDFASEDLAFATIGGVATGMITAHAAASLPPVAPILIGAAVTSAGLEYAGTKFTERAIDAGVKIVLPKVETIFDKAYEHLLTNDIVIDSGLKILMKQIVATFPPKN